MIQLRRWHEQFYRDIADVEPLMTRRFEWVADLDYANQVWDKQLLENLEKDAAAGLTVDKRIRAPFSTWQKETAS